jgi:hypothetical protein
MPTNYKLSFTGEELENKIIAAATTADITEAIAPLATKEEISFLATKEDLNNIETRMVNPNLLDNWYFGNPVNQRGQTSYESTNDVYCIDRWFVRRGVLTVGSSGINIKHNGTGTTNTVGLAQKLPAEIVNTIIGRPVTFSAVIDGKLYVHTWESPTAAQNMHSFSSDFSIILNLEAAWGAARPLQIFSTSTTGISIEAIKLELGSVQTLAHQDTSGNWVLNEIPNYGEQLARCQRYYIQFPILYLPMFTTSTDDGWVMAISLPVTMRTIPTVTCGELSALITGWYDIKIGSLPNVTESSVTLNVVKDAQEFTTRTWYVTRIRNLEISADL